MMILGSLGFFIYGMKTMSDGIQKAAGAQMRSILSSMTRNRYLGVLTGFLITALVQSSSATTVMTVSFVNAGLLSLVESAGVMMGANVGTTITGWIVSILGFKVKLSMYSIPMFAVGLPLLIAGKGKLKYWGEFIIGFAMLFLALSYLKESVPDLHNNPEALAFLQKYADYGIWSRLLFVFIGTLVTIIVQSSSAAMAITLTMCSQGWLPFEIATAMVLGENIGTTITAEIASLIGNVNAKRSARIHSAFNIIGVTWMVILMPVFLSGLENFMQNVMNLSNPFTNPESMPISLSAFHTAFNLTNVFLLIGFVPALVRIAKWSVPSQGKDKQKRLKYIGASLRNPELSTVELQKEITHYGRVVHQMFYYLRDLLETKDSSKQKKLLKRIRKYEVITDEIEIEINEYITALNKQEKTEVTSRKLNTYLNISGDMERIGDIFYQISKTLEQKIENRQYFVPEQRTAIKQLMQLLDEAFTEMIKILSQENGDDIELEKAKSTEAQINQLRDQMKYQNYLQLGEDLYDVKTAIMYINMASRLEKIGDLIYTIDESFAGKA